jgi:hypothetical protein
LQECADFSISAGVADFNAPAVIGSVGFTSKAGCGVLLLCPLPKIAVAAVLPCAAVEVTPLQKVVQMLEGVLAKGKQGKHEEEVEWGCAHHWFIPTSCNQL